MEKWLLQYDNKITVGYIILFLDAILFGIAVVNFKNNMMYFESDSFIVFYNPLYHRLIFFCIIIGMVLSLIAQFRLVLGQGHFKKDFVSADNKNISAAIINLQKNVMIHKLGFAISGGGFIIVTSVFVLRAMVNW